MARPVIPGMSADEQLKLYEQLQHYNAERDSYKVAGVYLLVIPHDGKSVTLSGATRLHLNEIRFSSFRI